jgi:hypothetical protein
VPIEEAAIAQENNGKAGDSEDENADGFGAKHLAARFFAINPHLIVSPRA